MIAPTVTRMQTLLGLDRASALLIRRLCALADEPERLAAYIERHCHQTHAYARSCYSDPYDSAMWRRTMILHAADVLLGTHGVEALDEGHSPSYAPPYEYCNAGDPYAPTLIYRCASDRLFIGDWGSIAERLLP